MVGAAVIVETMVFPQSVPAIPSNSIGAGLRPVIARTTRASRVREAPGGLRLARGVLWLPEATAPAWQHRYTLSLARTEAARLTHAPSAVLTHASAALRLGLPMSTRQPDVYIAVAYAPAASGTALPLIRIPARGRPTSARRPAPDAPAVRLWRRKAVFDADDVVVADGALVTSLLRTAFDCACDEPAHNALVIADAALRLFTGAARAHPEEALRRAEPGREAWRHMLEHAGRRKGIATARAVLAMASPLSESQLESTIRWLIGWLGLPPPVLQYRIDTRSGSYWVDLCWPDPRLIIEIDGRGKYDEPASFWRESDRQEDISGQRWTVRRIRSDQLHDLASLAARILSWFPPVVVAAARRRPELATPGWEPAHGLRRGSLLAGRRGPVAGDDAEWSAGL
ncbi:hypothetical protein CHIBA101_0275 [Actinomyces sp. Chiba101]|uniref:hypothetical protein n=1 Tax=Actinomyces TaxID=1654 RepID=UPI000974DCEA|nr:MULTISPECIES: hypothetical protein [Actinomyces]BAW92148.1 hypothetical protein CHIBA101_0275 [Actinomyces sp. Chiba101]GAV94913.1 hypothetical protein ADENT20671_1689 [Actinomyces denticolens]SUU11053.1 Uncharacterised protein [Actinomyces denticolens]